METRAGSKVQTLLLQIQQDHDQTQAGAAHEWAPTAVQVWEAGCVLARRGYRLDVDPDAAEALVFYYAAMRAGKADRGLFLYGKVGTGKTMFVRKACGRIRTAKQYVGLFKNKAGNTTDFAEACYGAYPPLGIAGGNRPMIIDDLGTEPICNLYGQRDEVLEIVLAERYGHWQKYGADAPTYITTNRTPEQLQERYGSRIMDRLRAMCVWVEFTAESVREQEQPKP